MYGEGTGSVASSPAALRMRTQSGPMASTRAPLARREPRCTRCPSTTALCRPLATSTSETLCAAWVSAPPARADDGLPSLAGGVASGNASSGWPSPMGTLRRSRSTCACIFWLWAMALRSSTMAAVSSASLPSCSTAGLTTTIVASQPVTASHTTSAMAAMNLIFMDGPLPPQPAGA
ncbi:hypothetical protein B1L07_12710 [Stenotrophomonas acidaminiphila]|nr:hypothetical protein B1L07_12710 [Stenotrophomonas acidaminiphila]